ncbi:VrrA/YqfQ family protein [Fictibacillus iocasae]|uniref:VrrA/YqfQ family protein n=1 Tax=Fictibacillus iocasae TaxID=2715437 RepID=A0ABW2NT75_9BACL
MPHHSMPSHQDPLNRLFGAIGTGGIPARTSVFSMLDNVQKVLKVAETMGPMVKQYGPMMRNLPSVLTMIKDYQSNSATKDEPAGTATNDPSDSKAEKAQEAAAPAVAAQEPDSDKVIIAGPAAKRKGQKKTKAPADALSVETAEATSLEEPGELPSFKKSKLSLNGQSPSLFKKAKREDVPILSPTAQDMTALESKKDSPVSSIADIPVIKRRKPAKNENSQKNVPSRPNAAASKGLSQPKLYI